MISKHRFPKQRRVNVSNVICYSPIEDVITKLQELEKKYSQYDNVRLRIEHEDEWGYPSGQLILMYDDVETNEEMQKRINVERKRQQYRRKEYEALKKEFENAK